MEDGMTVWPLSISILHPDWMFRSIMIHLYVHIFMINGLECLDPFIFLHLHAGYKMG